MANMNYIKIGLLAIIQLCAFACYLPQIIKTLRTKSGEDIAVSSWVISFVSVTCYLLYGIFEKDNFIIITCATEGVLAFVSVIVLYKYRNIK